MMGSKVRDFSPLTNVSLEHLVPADHFYRHLHKSLDLSFVRELVAPFYAAGGRPSVDPIVFFKLQLVMFFEGIRSERQLVRTAADRLSVRWYLGYDLHEELPDHSSLTRIRDRYGVDTFRRFFEHIVEQCQQAGLVWGKELYFDGTQVQANADNDAMLPRFYVEAMQSMQAIQTHLAALFPDQLNGQCDQAQVQDNSGPDEPGTPGTGIGPGLLRLISKLPQPTQQTLAEGEQLPEVEPHGHEHSQEHDKEQGEEVDQEVGRDWISRLGRPANRQPNSSYRRIADLVVSTTDPDATFMFDKNGGDARLGYHTHYAVDGGKARIILQALVTPSEVQDNQPMLDLLWRACFRWRLRSRQVTGDTRYGTMEILKAVEGAGIRAYIPVRNFQDNDGVNSHGVFGKQRFVYEAEADQYRCPGGEVLRFAAYHHTRQLKLYRARSSVCNACALKSQCTTNQKGREIKRDPDEEYAERVRAYQNTPAYRKALAKRRVWVEPLFGEAKQWHGLERFRLRGLEKVNMESLLIASGQNLKRLLRKWGWGRRPGPNGVGLAVSIQSTNGAYILPFSLLGR